MDIYSVLVTGANRGIGLEFVRQLVQLNPRPKHIFATYRSTQNLQHLNEIRESCDDATTVHLIQLDVTNLEDVKKAKDVIADVVKDNGLTVLINNAGVAQVDTFPNVPMESLLHHFKTNTIGPIVLLQEMYPLLKLSAQRKPKEAKGLSFSRAGVLNISSIAGSVTNAGVVFTEDLAVPAYKTSKAGLNMAMRSFAATTKQDNILMVCMCPGWVRTDMGTELAQIEPKDSIGRMLETLSKLDESNNGMFMDRFGKPYPF